MSNVTTFITHNITSSAKLSPTLMLTPTVRINNYCRHAHTNVTKGYCKRTHVKVTDCTKTGRGTCQTRQEMHERFLLRPSIPTADLRRGSWTCGRPHSFESLCIHRTKYIICSAKLLINKFNMCQKNDKNNCH